MGWPYWPPPRGLLIGLSLSVLGRATAPEQGSVPGQAERPSLVAVDAVADRLPAGTVPVEVAVLQFDRREGHDQRSADPG